MVRLVLSGGGLKCLSFIGAYDALSEERKESIDEIYGVSGGSIMGLSIVLSIPPDDIIMLLKTHYPFQRAHMRVSNLLTKFGLDTGDDARAFVRAMLERGGLSGDATMRALADKKICLHVCVTNLTTYQKELFTPDDDVKIVDAIQASCTIPILFAPTRIRDAYYIDGSALWYSFPSDLLTGPDDIGFSIMNKVCTEREMTLGVFAQRLMTLFSMYFSPHDIDKKDDRVVYFDDIKTQLIIFDACPDDDIQDMLVKGRAHATRFSKRM